MTRDVPQWFAQLMVLACEACSGTRLREGTVRTYWALLGEFPEPQLSAAVAAAIKEGNDFIPSVAAIRRQLVPSGEDVGMLAWNGLHTAASAIGAYAPLVCEDPAVAWAVRQVFASWPSFCEQALDVASYPWTNKRAEFLAAYRAARRQRLPGALPERLAGLLGPADERLPAGTWGGLLTASGEVRHEREPARLPAAEVAALPEAEFGD